MNKSFEDFERLRSELTRLAYGILGTRVDVDDILQDAYLRWTTVNPTSVNCTSSYLRTIVTRLCIDRRHEIEKRKETYIGTWLPEPIVDYPKDSPESRAELADSLSFAMMHLLESLSPTERAAYLLRQVFGYDYTEVSAIVGETEINCRQLVSRAESRVLSGRPRFNVKSAELERVIQEFLRSCSTGDLQGLVSLLAEDVAVYSDGGGKATAALKPILGVDRVARFLIGVFKKSAAGLRVERAFINSQIGFVIHDGLQPNGVWSIDCSGGRIQSCYIIRNPEKLADVQLPANQSVRDS